MKSRRYFLGGVASAAAVLPFATETNASQFNWRSGAPRQLATMTIVNDSHHDSAESSVMQIVGCPFRKGDIPSGQWPQFQLQDGTPVPCTLLTALATTWSDKSLKFVPAMLQIPIGIGAKQKLVVNIFSNGALSQAGARTLADLQAGVDPQVQVDGLDNLSGTWAMDLGEGISKGTKIVTYGNGPAGAVWKIRARAQQKGKFHKQLVCDFYVAALSNADGSLKGLRILGKIKLPYYDSSSAMKWVSFSRFQLCSNSSGGLIRDCFGKNFGARRAYPFAWVSGPTFSANHGYSLLNSGDYGYCTRFTTTGTLPAGLSGNVSYFTGNPAQSTINFYTSSTCAGYPVSATDGGAGTHTATPYPFLAYFGALFTAGHHGTWDFVQGAGSDTADTTLRCEVDKRYWASTRLIPPYSLKVKAVNNAPTKYWPNSAEPVTRFLSQTGDRDDLGILPAWYARHFATQSEVDERVVRVISLVGGQFSIGLENSRTKTYPCVNNGSDGSGRPYDKMPTPNPLFFWGAGVGTTNGFPNGDTTDPNVQVAGFTQQDTTHMPQFNYYPYLLTGEPWHLDMLLEHANNAVYQRNWSVGQAVINEDEFELGDDGGGVRNVSINSKSWYGNTIGGATGQLRTDAWATALLAAAAGICPDNHPECKSYRSYFNDMHSSSWKAAKAIISALPSYSKTLWTTPYAPNFCQAPWQMAYFGAAAALAAGTAESMDAVAALQYHAHWFDYVSSHFGGWHLGAYHSVAKTGNNLGAPLINSSAPVAFYGPNLNWQSGGHFVVNPLTNYVPSNGDKVVFTDDDGGGQVVPAGFTKYTPYYIVNLAGSQFDLAKTRHGLPVPVVDTYAGAAYFYIVASNPPATGSISEIGSPASYSAHLLGMLNYAIAVGVQVSNGTMKDLNYRIQQAGTDYSTCPKWAIEDRFKQ